MILMAVMDDVGTCILQYVQRDQGGIAHKRKRIADHRLDRIGSAGRSVMLGQAVLDLNLNVGCFWATGVEEDYLHKYIIIRGEGGSVYTLII